MKEEKTVIRIKKYSIEVIEYSDKSICMNRTNDGFSAIELLGMCHIISLDIQDQMNGIIKPTKVNRSIITDND